MTEKNSEPSAVVSTTVVEVHRVGGDNAIKPSKTKVRNLNDLWLEELHFSCFSIMYIQFSELSDIEFFSNIKWVLFPQD